MTSDVEQVGKTRKLLIKQYKSYPEMEIGDLFKFLHQSVFGCEHMVTSVKAVTDYIAKEYDESFHNGEAVTEELDGPFCRVPLSVMNVGLSAQTLGKLFYLSARKETGSKNSLVSKLKVAGDLICEGVLPFNEDEYKKAVSRWETEGFTPLHHTDSYRKTYKPAYRVVAKEYTPFIPLLARLDQMLEKGNVRLAVEGGSAAGKTTLGKLLSEIYECTLFHMDDFFLRPEQRTSERYAETGGNVDRERFLAEVLLPLSRGEKITYKRFDCAEMKLTDGVEVTPKNLVVTEGAYSMHPDLEKYYDLSVFLNVSEAVQKERILKRNGPGLAKRFFEEWIPLERRYFIETNVCKRCDMIIDI